ncbi:hypothetical protein [Plantactinospora sp. KLBMP9567]|uniref:hypothetical protein n=1 Tax=Plantactinospora sp. KLBMP9567 TaxID=3085900 RepID=UPI002980C1D9|nr:hypothetical protein [Plantactinospora sp. KLBMP9567]MDW5325165.1 hypothetical protein [Plantactinospora sp. KLBMP9567]
MDRPSGTLAGIGRVTSLDDVLLKAAGAGLVALSNRSFDGIDSRLDAHRGRL